MASTKQVKYRRKTPSGKGGRSGLQPARVVLIGFMGSGKSAVGPLLARRLRLAFVDLDRSIAHEAGMAIPLIFKRRGEGWFRGTESRLLRHWLGRAPIVIAGGGGMVKAAGNRRALRRAGAVVVWLDVSWPELWRRLQRVGSAGRPLLRAAAGGPKSKSAIQALHRERRALYGRAASVRISVRTGESAERTAARIAEKLQKS